MIDVTDVALWLEGKNSTVWGRSYTIKDHQGKWDAAEWFYEQMLELNEWAMERDSG